MFTTPTTVTADVATTNHTAIVVSHNDNYTYENENESTRGTSVGNSSSNNYSSSESSPAHTVGSAGAQTHAAPPSSSAKGSTPRSHHRHGRHRAAGMAEGTARGGTGQDNHQVTRPSPLRSVMMAT